MSLKVLLGSVIGGIVLVTGAYFTIAPRVSDTPSVLVEEDAVEEYTEEREDTEEIDVEEEAGEDENESEDVTESSPAPVVTETTPVPAPTPTPVEVAPAPTPKPSGFTMADVAKHADATSCWSVIRGTVYDLTDWVSKYPGGKSKILGICGEDGTKAFESQHGKSSKVATILAQYRLGDLI